LVEEIWEIPFFAPFSSEIRGDDVEIFQEIRVKVFALLGCYNAYVCTCAPTFRDNILVPFSRVKQSEKNDYLTLESEGNTTIRNVGNH
jgi:hypothetical protein